MTRYGLPLIHLAFFGSGFAALLYQVTWQRLLALFAGSDVVSGAIVVSAFLAGLGLGSLAGGLLADRLRRRQALAAFALCNLAIALFGLASKPLYYDFLFLRLDVLTDSRALVGLVAFLALLPPTFLMGLSLPCLSRAVVDEIERAARRIGLLYGADVVGAALGAFVGTWYLIGTFGIDGTIHLAALLSLAVAGLAALAWRSLAAPDLAAATRP
ncbi:MAG: spermidine synthase, partial [Alphaproteobacteria bacterium]|nr:spermidine synthase [Alphaproteobacteria bacterium]